MTHSFEQYQDQASEYQGAVFSIGPRSLDLAGLCRRLYIFIYKM